MPREKIKILYAITKSNWGGAQKYVYDLATHLPTDTYEVLCLLGQAGELQLRLTQANIRTIVLPDLDRNISLKKDWATFWQMIKIFRQEKPDILHLNSSKIGGLGALAGRLTGISKIIFTGHGWAFNENRNYFQKKIIYCLYLLTIALAHQTIAVSDKTRNDIPKNKYFSKKIITIKNGLAPTTALDKETARKILREKLPANLDMLNKFWLGTISELHKNKGLKYLVRAIHLLKNTADKPQDVPLVVIIGEGEERAQLQKEIKRYSLEGDVFLVGNISNAGTLIPALDIFTLTSITEALPYVLLEAGQTGAPIIASAVGGIPEIITDKESGLLIEVGDTKEISQAIDFMLKNPEKARLFGENLKNKINQYFNLKQMLEKTIALYK